MTSPLLAPFRFRNGVGAPNRIWLAPMTNSQSHADGTLSDDELHWLERRAAGGFGVIETCAAHVAEDGQGWAGELGVFADRLVPGLTRIAEMVARHHCVGLAQIFHGGLRADPKLTGGTTWSASAVEETNVATPRAASEEDIARVIEQFRDAAVRCHRAGLAGVELHGAHGYLLCQFLSATQNVRTDRWGGTLENRARLLRETLRAVRAAVPAGFVVGVRISPEDRGNARGLDLDESLAVARWLAEDGADFLGLSLWDSKRPTAKRPTERPIPLFRAALPTDVPLVVAGGIWTRADGEALLVEGADAVALGRAAIANPEWPHSIEHPTWEPRRPPLTIGELRDRGLSEVFAAYMRQWKGFVAD